MQMHMNARLRNRELWKDQRSLAAIDTDPSSHQGFSQGPGQPLRPITSNETGVLTPLLNRYALCVRILKRLGNPTHEP